MAIRYTVKCLDKALDILEYVANAKQGVKLAVICRQLQLKPPTAHNLLQTLLRRGYVEKLRGPIRYRLGPAYAGICWPQQHAALLEAARPVAYALARKTGGEVHLETLIAGVPCSILQASPTKIFVAEPALPMPMGKYGSGLIFLVFPPAPECMFRPERKKVLERALEWWGSVDAMRQYIEEAWQEGCLVLPPPDYRQQPGERTATFRAIMPLLDERGYAAAAMGVFIDEAMTPDRADEVIKHLRQAARTLSHAHTSCVAPNLDFLNEPDTAPRSRGRKIS